MATDNMVGAGDWVVGGQGDKGHICSTLNWKIRKNLQGEEA